MEVPKNDQTVKTHRLTIIRSTRYGTIRLRFISFGDFKFLSNLDKSNLSDRDFTVRVLHHQMVRSELSEQDVCGMPDRLLLHIARKWSQRELPGVAGNEIQIHRFAGFHQVIKIHIEQVNAHLTEAVRQFSQSGQNVSKALAQIFQNQAWVENLRKSNQALFGAGQVAAKILSDNNSGFLATVTEIARVETVLAGIHSNLHQAFQSSEIREGLMRMGNMVSQLTITPGLTAALQSLSKPTLLDISRVTFDASKQLVDAVSAAAIELSELPRLVLSSSAAWPQTEPGRLFIPELPDLGYLDQYRKGAKLPSKERVVKGKAFEEAFDATLNLYLLNGVKNVDLYSRDRIEPDLISKTRSPGSETTILQPFVLSQAIRPRYPNLRDALTAHQQGKFALAIPALLSLLEGILTDILVLRNLISRKGEKVFDLATGRELNGLHQKLKYISGQFSTSPTGSMLVEFMKEWLGPTRNAVMHGSPTAEYSPEISTWLIVIIHYLGWQIVVFEKSNLLM
ncbi:MAG: hypothetical protein PHQ40_05660 [Anaerolineaceae bacterium]|nr:hypothetical protein [Anaerolineaceae bacterium]